MNIFTKKGYRKIALLITVCTSISGTSVFAQNSDKTILSIEKNKTDNTPVSITFSPVAKWSPDRAQDIFKKYLGVDGVNVTMVLANTTTTKMQVTTDRYGEYYKGIMVSYGSFTLMSKNGVVDYMTGNYYDFNNTTSSVPAVTESDAFTKALNYVGAQKYMWQDPASELYIKNFYHNDTSYLPHGQLEWIEDYNNGNDDRKLHLAYSFDIYAVKPVSRQKVYIDAATGNVLYSNSLIKHTAVTGHSEYSGVIPFQSAHVGATYELFDSTRGNGVHTQNMHNGTTYGAATDFTTATDTWPSATADTVALDAHWGGEIVYDYWKNVQGRLSWNNANGILLQYVHYDNAYDNAFWDGAEMNYGDGSGCAGGGFTPLTSLDVTAHEIGHGVCQATCNLVYSKESGGIDEGLSDCWGATIENWGNPHEVDAVPKQTWWMGEEIGCGTPLRRLDYPKLFGLPDTYLGVNWYPVTTCTPGGGNDQCGVHTNMGVISKWYYLLTEGGSGTNDLGSTYAVAGQGFTISQNILYQTELVLASNATYPVLRTTSIATATTLYGACSAEVQAVTSAWYAVGVGADFVPCVPEFGFTNEIEHAAEKASVITCPASHVINIGVKPFGPAITGGNPTVNIVVVPGATAVAGVDYVLGTTALTWIAGDTTTHNATITINDNGAINDSKNMRLAFTLSAAGSTATISPTYDTMQLYIDNDDSIPQLGGVQYHTLNIGTLVTSNLTSAFTGSGRRGHSQFLLYASEMTAAGVRPGAPISQIAFNITTKNSTAPFIGYTLSMGNTTTADLTTAYATGLTQVFTGTHTTNLGLDSINFNTGTFTWDGTSNVAVEVCYGQNAAAFSANEQMDGIQGGQTVANYNTSNTGTGTGCSLTYSTANQSTARPVMRFKQTVSPTTIETVATSTHTWDVHAGQEVYFYTGTPDTSLIAGLKNITNDLGCVTATVTQAGVGFTPAVFAPINRSLKEISITPTINGATTTYNATMYLTNTELNSVAAGTLFLVKTDAPTDATVSTANSVELTPTLLTGTNYVGFEGTFTGFSRFFLVDGPLCNLPAAVITPAGPTTFCNGSNVVLNSPAGTYTYQWQVGGANIAGATNASYTATTAGSYKLILGAGTCNDTSVTPVAVTVNTVSVSPITGASSVCIAQTASLSDITAGGVWSSANSSFATIDASGVVTGVSSGTAVISYSYTNSCGTAVATATVTAGSGISVSPESGVLTECVGGTTTLSDPTSSGVWSSGNGAVATVSSSGVVTGVGAGTVDISYSVTNLSGCVSSAVATVTVNSSSFPAVITPSGSTTFCSGGYVVLSATTGAGYTYQWQVGGVNVTGAMTAAYTATTGGAYTVIIRNSSGCTSTSAAVTVTVNAGPSVTPAVGITSSLGTVLCVTSSTETFTAGSTNGGTSPAYQWYVNGAATAAGATYTYTPASGDIVKCLLTSNDVCAFPDTAAADVVITISPNVSPSVSIVSSPATVCSGDTVTFSAVPVYGGSLPTYLWTENGTNVATGPQYIYGPHNGDILVVTMTSNYACLATNIAVSNSFFVNVSAPSPNTLTVYVTQATVVAGKPDTFVAVAPNGGASPVYQWFINGVAVPGATGSTYITDSLRNGQYVNCSVTSSEPCATPGTVVSGLISVPVLPNSVQQVAANGNDFILLPNPNKGEFTISGALIDQADQRVNIVITDMLGQTVYTHAAEAHNGVLNEHIILNGSIAAGTYLVNVTSGGAHAVFHVVIDK